MPWFSAILPFVITGNINAAAAALAGNLNSAAEGHNRESRKQCRAVYSSFDLKALGSPGVAGAALVTMLWPREQRDKMRQLWEPRLTRVLRLMDQGLPAELTEDDPHASEAAALREEFAYDSRPSSAIPRCLRVGHLAMPFLKHAESGVTDMLPGMTALSEAEMIRAIERKLGEPIDPSNFYRSEWNPWLPSVHLAASMRSLMEPVEHPSVSFDIMSFLHDTDMLSKWLGRAELIEPAAVRAFPKIAETIARVRVIDFKDEK